VRGVQDLELERRLECPQLVRDRAAKEPIARPADVKDGEPREELSCAVEAGEEEEREAVGHHVFAL